MLLLPTYEVRWFYRGPAPPAVRTWLRAGGRAPLAEPVRIDRYLDLPGTDWLGIKLRQSRVEVKRREGGPVRVQFSERAEGHVEMWRKWNFALDDAQEAAEGMAGTDAEWVSVEKDRWSCALALGWEGAAPAATPAVADCFLELVEVSLGGERWWTLGFEAPGEGATTEASLLAIARTVLSEAGAPTLDAGASYGYARWLDGRWGGARGAR